MTDWLDEPGRAIAEEHDALVTARALQDVLLLDYRCPQGCLLLHVYSTPRGRMFYLPRYQLSRTKTPETADAARAHRTEDGDHKWPARGGSLDDLLDFFAHDPAGGGLPLNCRHMRRTVLAEHLAEDTAEATPGRPTRKRITSDS